MRAPCDPGLAFSENAMPTGRTPGLPLSDLIADRARVRHKLLDLTTSNRLLNFRYSDRSARVVQIVDEQPDQVYETLVKQSKAMELIPLPEEDDDSDDQDEAPVGELSENAGGLDSQPLPDPAPRQLQLPLDQRDIAPPEEDGVSIKLDPDLPEPYKSGDDVPEKHRDRRLQTKLDIKTLDRRLRAISADASRAIEETSINLLYLAIGFLEWREQKDSEKAYLAPLILVPVSMHRERSQEGPTYAYELEYTGEDIEKNLSLGAEPC